MDLAAQIAKCCPGDVVSTLFQVHQISPCILQQKQRFGDSSSFYRSSLSQVINCVLLCLIKPAFNVTKHACLVFACP